VDIDKALESISDIDSAMREAENLSRSLWDTKNIIYQAIKESLVSGHRTDDPLRDFALFHYDFGHEKALPALRLFAERLEQEAGNPVVIKKFRWRFAGRDERGSSSHIPVSQTETLGILDEPGYEIDEGFNFMMPLRENTLFMDPPSGSKGRITQRDHVLRRESRKYHLKARDITALSRYQGGSRFANSSREVEIFLSEGIPEQYRNDGRILTPGKFATLKRRYIRELNERGPYIGVRKS
jgi:hypothetical protein